MKTFIAKDGRLRAGWRFLLSVGVFLLAAIIAEVITVLVLGPRPEGFQLGFEAVSQTAIVPLLLGGFVLLLRYLDRERERPLGAMGMGVDRPWVRETLVGFGFGAVLIALGVAAVGVFGSLTFHINANAQSLNKTALLFWVLGLAALKEELLFRGYPFQRLVEGAGRAIAILILSALFGLAHMNNPNASAIGVTNTILVGVMFAVAFLQTRSLWFVWGLHFGWNFVLGVVFGLPVSGIDMSSAVKGEAQGHELLTGGAYGLEASLTGTCLIVLALAIVARSSTWFVRPAAAINPVTNGIQPSREA
jgi:hypothetical protein